MTVEDLMAVYDLGFGDKLTEADTWGQPTAHRAGVTAIVRALAPDDDEVAAYTRLTLRVRKEMPCECEYLPEDRCISCEVADALTCLEKRYHEILGDAGEKVGTHGSPELDEDARKLEAMGQDPGMTLEELLAPATDAAPAECVWTRISEFDTVVHYSTPHGVMNDLHLWRGLQCSACHAPITFTEANHG